MSENPAIIPAPQQCDLGEGSAALRPDALLSLAADLEPWAPHAARLAREVADEAPSAPEPSETTPTPATVAAHDPSLPAEGYTLDLSPEQVRLTAADAAGAYWAVQTLRQAVAGGRVPTMRCSDAPAYPVRGLMLDVARHFFGVTDIERAIDLASRYKLNQVHLHLTDDQGWRLEIENRPLLTERASANDVDGGGGGFLTLADYARLQDYAEARHVVVVPEVDLPGHTHAAQVAYPEISPDGAEREPYAGIEVGFSSVHLTSPTTWEWLDDVVGTLARHTRGQRIHLGGDEVHTLGREEYHAFLEQLGALASTHGKELILWQEAAEATLPAGTLLQYWTHEIDASGLGEVARTRDVGFIASPAKHAYLDLKYDDDFPLGLTWAGTVEVRDAYDWEPVDALPGIPAESIRGVEACLWSETLRTWEDVATMLLPRLPAVASVAWGSPRDWDTFRTALAAHVSTWRAANLPYHPSPQIDW